MNGRAIAALAPYLKSYGQTPPPALVQAVAVFAAQNPGFDPRDYDSATYYRADQRTACRGMADVRQAVRACWLADVTDADVIEASKGGRLTVERLPDNRTRVEYCAGQYWPTEYRDACARVLEAAARLATYRATEATQAPAGRK